MAVPARVPPADGSQAADAAAAAAVASEAAWTQTRALLRSILVILFVAAALWLLYALEGVLLLVVFAVFFAYLISPLVELVRQPFQLGRRECHVGLAPAIDSAASATALTMRSARASTSADAASTALRAVSGS